MKKNTNLKLYSPDKDKIFIEVNSLLENNMIDQAKNIIKEFRISPQELCHISNFNKLENLSLEKKLDDELNMAKSNMETNLKFLGLCSAIGILSLIKGIIMKDPYLLYMSFFSCIPVGLFSYSFIKEHKKVIKISKEIKDNKRIS